jgi:hypothetical protein
VAQKEHKKGIKNAFSLITKDRENYVFVCSSVEDALSWVDTIKKGNEQFKATEKTIGTLEISIPQGRKLTSKIDNYPCTYASAYIESQQFITPSDQKTINPVWFNPFNKNKSCANL